MSEQTSTTSYESSDPWVSRIGAPAAGLLASGKKQRRTAMALLLVAPAAALGVWWLFAGSDGNPQGLAVAGLCVVGVVVGIFGLGWLSAAFQTRGRAVDLALAFLRHSYADITAFEVHIMVGSLAAFDVSVAGRPSNYVADVVTPNWSPDIVRPILPGATEATLVSIHRWTLVVGVIPALGLAALGATRHLPSNNIWFTGWSIVGVIFLISFGFWLAALSRSRQEFRAGYTTSPTGTMLVGRGQTRPVDAHSSLDFVDGKTGYLLRHSNAVPLSPPIYRERLRQIRLAHPTSTPTRIEVGVPR